jgi:TATA-binding protein-associated factor Taf7
VFHICEECCRVGCLLMIFFFPGEFYQQGDESGAGDDDASGAVEPEEVPEASGPELDAGASGAGDDGASGASSDDSASGAAADDATAAADDATAAADDVTAAEEAAPAADASGAGDGAASGPATRFVEQNTKLVDDLPVMERKIQRLRAKLSHRHHHHRRREPNY